MRRTKEGCKPVLVAGGACGLKARLSSSSSAVIESEHAQAAVVGEQRADEGASERLAGGFDQRDRVFVDGGRIEQGLEDGGEVADRDLLAQKLLQHLLHLAEGQDFGDKFFDQLGVAFAQAIEQALGLLRG